MYVGRDGNGRPLQSSKNFAGSAAAADTALRRFVDQVEAARRPERNATVERLLDRWIEHIHPERTPNTIHGYKAKAKRINKALGSTRIDRLSGHDLDVQYRRWIDSGLSPATVRQLHAILAAALQQAYRWEWLAENPARRAKAPSVHRRPLTAITPEELRALVTEGERRDPMLGAAIALAALTGARRGELCALRWSDVDLERNVLTIDKAISDVGGVVTVGDTKTHEGRRIALDPVAQQVLRMRRAGQEQLAVRAGSQLVDDPWILSRRADGGAPCLPAGLTHSFTGGRTALGMGWRFHDLRHFAATTAITAGVDIRTVAGRLGHADASTTLRVYAHAVAVADQQAAAALGAALSPAP